MRQTIVILLAIILLTSCSKEEAIPNSLQAYIESFSEIEFQGVIACAANNPDSASNFDIFFYPSPNANNFKYWESASQDIDASNLNNYFENELAQFNVFNGYLKRFSRAIPNKENWSVVTFEIGSKLYISDPIIQKPISNPTEINSELITVTENATTPSFSWQDGIYNNNDIYFQVISDLSGNLISGTYTRALNFAFYNTSNVVLDINEGVTPTLKPDENYMFTLMSVDDDNWVNVFARKEFSTGD